MSKRPRKPSAAASTPSLSLASVTTAPVTNKATVGDEDSPVWLGAPATNDTSTLNAPLANGASVTINFLLGIQQSGSFRFYVIVETLP
ncbi:MAG: hypothetical protein LC754_00870 [Acidobacteria bacterium]|nr:hypothetical protein [Acidobacteriota bacterium]